MLEELCYKGPQRVCITCNTALENAHGLMITIRSKVNFMEMDIGQSRFEKASIGWKEVQQLRCVKQVVCERSTLTTFVCSEPLKAPAYRANKDVQQYLDSLWWQMILSLWYDKGKGLAF